ncbi:MAG: hypothetical protein QXS51_01330 [Thermoproteota archaeon]
MKSKETVKTEDYCGYTENVSMAIFKSESTRFLSEIAGGVRRW